jgi:hypothetical protein
MPVPEQDRHAPYLFRKLESTVLPEILLPVIFFTAVAVVVCVVCEQTGYAMEVSTVMLSVVSTYLSLAPGISDLHLPCLNLVLLNPALTLTFRSLTQLTTMLSFAISLRTTSAVERFGEGKLLLTFPRLPTTTKGASENALPAYAFSLIRS